jgi:tricorn protease
MASLLRSRLTVLALLTVACCSGTTRGQEPIRFARTPDISPDGKLIAFSYLGDIYVVQAIGGVARAVTSHPAHDINPVFSPDGQSLAFSSNRHGSYDVFVVSVHGGRPRRLTFDSANDLVTGWSHDGKQVLFTSARADYPQTSKLYTVPVEGGRVRLVTAGEGKEGAFSPRGDLLAYVRGPGAWYRKNYRGSANDDIWIARADGSDHRRVTTFIGQDTSPMWSGDGQSLYYVSEFHGTSNIVHVPLAPFLSGSPGKPAVESIHPRALTNHTEEGVRRARISRDGNWIVYECGADLWVMGTREGCKPRKLAIEVYADDKANPERVVTFTRGATEFVVSGDERFVAFAVHGKLFRMPIASNARVTQMTFGPSNDHGMAWAPDASKMIFISDRSGHDDLYLLEPDDPDHPKFTEANRFKVTQLTNTREAEFGVSFAPDGKRVAFLRGGRLLTMAPDGKDGKVVVDQATVFDYEWSPDGKWIVFARRDGSFASELYMVPATGPTAAEPIRNITRYATFNSGVTWSANGKKLAFLSERRGTGTLHVMELEKPAAETDKKPMLSSLGFAKPTVAIDWDDLHLRVKPVVPGLVDEAAISPDGRQVAYRDAINQDLWVTSSTGSQITRLTTGRQRPRLIQWSKRRSPLGETLNVLYYLDGDGQLKMARASASDGRPGDSSNSATLPFKIKMTVKRDELFLEMFDQSWRYLAENFYDVRFHGLEWDTIRARYRPLVQHVAHREDLYALLYLMMGELNASHLGVSGFVSGPEEDTAELGLLFDESYKGKGLKIAEILKRGPADRKGLTLRPGEIVVAIDGVELDDSVNVSKLLNGKVDEPIVLQVTATPADPKSRRRVEIRGMNRYRDFQHRETSVNDLMYDRWVARNAARVQELSKGKLGYIHIPSMDDEGLDRFVRSLYSDNFDKEAIVLDVRFNGGGFTHDQVLNYLGSKEHTIFRQREGTEGLVLRSADRKWHKPLVLLINNRSYSDAEILPNAFRTLGLGKLVGEPTGGLVIGTGVVQLIDGSLFRIPRIGVYTTRGVNMEKEGVKPDILVEPHPDELARGIDAQLDKAIRVLQADVIAWKKKRGLELASGEEPRPVVPVGPPAPGTTPMPPPGTPGIPPAGRTPEVSPGPVKEKED